MVIASYWCDMSNSGTEEKDTYLGNGLHLVCIGRAPHRIGMIGSFLRILRFSSVPIDHFRRRLDQSLLGLDTWNLSESRLSDGFRKYNGS